MRQIIFILVVIAFFSCGQTDTNQKESELNERELALKKKEFDLKQKDIASNQTTSLITTPTTEIKADALSDFKIFWEDFKRAVNAGDKDAVAKMTYIPFIDYTGEALYKYSPEEGKALTSNSVDEFKTNYDKIFVPELIRLINSNKYRGWNKTKDKTDQLGKVIKKGEYLLPGINYTEGFNFFEGGLAFSKIGGIFKLSYIPFYHNPDEGN